MLSRCPLASSFFGCWIYLLMILCSFSGQANASILLSEPGYLLAQAEDDSFDPFSDYSEFDEATDEEADINFFRNGRFLTVGFLLGARSFTDRLSTAYNSSGTYGVYMAYFFDLRFALQFSFSTSDHSFSFSNTAGQTDGGDVSLSTVAMDFKYYFNTQNVTKGLADLNPYMIAGFADTFRTYTLTSSVTGQVVNGSLSAWGLDIGAGIEIPMMKKKAYFGFQGIFHYVTFADSNSPFFLSDFNSPSKGTQAGYPYDLLALVGVNF